MPILTNRISTVFKRSIYVNLVYNTRLINTMNCPDEVPSEFNNIYEDLDRNGVYSINKIDFGEFQLDFVLCEKYRDDDYICNGNCDCGECDCKTELMITLFNEKCSISVLNVKSENINEISIEFNNWIEQFVDRSYELCRCKRCFTVLDNACIDCFPFLQRGEENCCICLLNEVEIWVELKPCNHKIHEYCAENLEKCPLCRCEIKTRERI